MHISKPFRLLDLPREVRDAVYHKILCDWPRAELMCDKPNAFYVPPKMVVMDHKIETTISLANKQIHQEAKHVMIKGNQFIHIKIRASDISMVERILGPCQVSLVTTKRDRCTRFKDLTVMTHFIEALPGSSQFRFDAIILRRDLDLVCQGIAAAGVVVPHFAAESKHEITIHNPFAKTSSPDYLNRKNQERLLEPYRSRLQGFDQFKIEGRVELDLAEAVVAGVKQDPALPAPHELLEKLLHLKELGNQAFRQNNMTGAMTGWGAALREILLASRNKAWPRLKEVGGKNFTDQVSELYFQLLSNQAYRSIKATQASASNRETLQLYARVAQGCLSKATDVAKTLGTDWKPSNEQMAKYSYRLALAHRLGEGDISIALAAINFAAEALPDDKMVQREKFLVEEWEAGRWIGVAP